MDTSLSFGQSSFLERNCKIVGSPGPYFCFFIIQGSTKAGTLYLIVRPGVGLEEQTWVMLSWVDILGEHSSTELWPSLLPVLLVCWTSHPHPPEHRRLSFLEFPGWLCQRSCILPSFISAVFSDRNQIFRALSKGSWYHL